MAEFPRVQSRAQITTQPGSVQRGQDNTGEMLQQGGELLSKTSTFLQEYKKSNDLIRKTVASTNLADGILDIQQRFFEDPDPKNYEKYKSELETKKTTAVSGLDPVAALEVSHQAKIAELQLQNTFYKKNIEIGTIAAERKIEQHVNEAQPGSFTAIKDLLAEYVDKKLIDPTKAYQLEVKANKDLGVNKINQDLNKAVFPEDVDEISRKITSGYYEQGGVIIDAKEKNDFLSVAEKTKNNLQKKLEAENIELKARNRVDTILAIASNKTPIESLDMTAVAEEDSELAQVLTKTKAYMVNYNPKLPPSEQRMVMFPHLSDLQNDKAKSYAKSVMDVFLQNDNESLGNFIVKELEQKGDGNTSSVKIAAFANLAALKARVNNPQSNEDVASKNYYEGIKSAAMFLQQSNPIIFPHVLSDFLVKNYLSGTSNPEKIMQEAKDTLKPVLIEKHRSLTKLPYGKTPNKIVDGDAPVEDLQSGVNDFDSNEEKITRAEYSDAQPEW